MFGYLGKNLKDHLEVITYILFFSFFSLFYGHAMYNVIYKAFVLLGLSLKIGDRILLVQMSKHIKMYMKIDRVSKIKAVTSDTLQSSVINLN